MLLAMLFLVSNAIAQKTEIKWHNPATEKYPTVHNQGWSDKEIKSFYDRLPSKMENTVRPEVWNLSRTAAGLELVFNTTAEQIIIRYVTTKKKYAMNHFPATGVSGVDLFAENKDGSWAWANGKADFKDTITYSYASLDLDKDQYKSGRKFHLFLPLYNGVKWLEIGVPEGSGFKFIPVTDEKPIITYGTSITQGGCASRPGMAWTNILSRKLHTPVVNLGFSGNGKLEKEIIDLMAEKDAKIFIIDCVANMGADIKNIKSKHTDAVITLRAKHPNTPIVVVEQPHYTEGRFTSARARGLAAMNKELQDSYKELKSKGVKNVYYLTYADIGFDMNDSVDGTHPTDMGMLKYANAFEKLLKPLLK